MKNNQRITAIIILTVFMCTLLIGAGQKFLKPFTVAVPAAGKPIIRLTKDNGENRRENKELFKRKKRENKNESADIKNTPKINGAKSLKDNNENSANYNNRGGKCPEYNGEDN